MRKWGKRERERGWHRRLERGVGGRERGLVGERAGAVAKGARPRVGKRGQRSRWGKDSRGGGRRG